MFTGLLARHGVAPACFRLLGLAVGPVNGLGSSGLARAWHWPLGHVLLGALSDGPLGWGRLGVPVDSTPGCDALLTTPVRLACSPWPKRASRAAS